MSRHTKVLTRSFAGGEMSPEMFSRLDDALFQAGAETLLNCIPRPTGSTARRAGTRLVRQTRDSSNIAHLFAFVFSQTESAVIEGSRATIGGVEGGYFRFHTNGGTLLYPQPDRWYRPALNVSATASFLPNLTVTASNSGGDLLLTTDVSHGLQNTDLVQFISANRTLPDGVTQLFQYLVRERTDTTFKIETLLNAGALAYGTHGGVRPVVYSWRLRDNVTARQNFMLDEHRIRNKDPVVFTMRPETGVLSKSPLATFAEGRVRLSRSPVIGAFYLGVSTSAFTQQIIFVTNGGTLPANVEEGRLYWLVSYDATNGWEISETRGGPPLDPGQGGVGDIRVAVTPRAFADTGDLECLKKFYAITNANDPNVLKIEESIAAGQAPGGGFQFDPWAIGVGPFKLHRAYDLGDIVCWEESGEIRSFYSQKSWWDPEFSGDRNRITVEIHSGSGARTPGARTSAEEGAYWREMLGQATGGRIEVDANEYTTGSTDLLLTSKYNHGLETGMQVVFVDGILPDCNPNIATDTPYWVRKVDGTQFKLCPTLVDAIANINIIIGPESATPRHGSLVMQAFVTVEEASYGDYVIWPGHSLVAGDTVVFSKSPEAGLTAGTIELGRVYYVRDVQTLPDRFRIAETPSGPLLAISVDGDRHQAIGNSILELPHDYSAAELPRISTTQSGDIMTLASQDHPVRELRRIRATTWELTDPDFVAAVEPPGPAFKVLVEEGEGVRIVQSAMEGARFRFLADPDIVVHPFPPGTPVYVSGMPPAGLGSLVVNGETVASGAGHFITAEPSGRGNGQELNIYLVEVESGREVEHGGASPMNLDGRIRYSVQGQEQTNTYVVTAIDQNNEESAANEPLTLTNNLSVDGASNTIGWPASDGAVRYRVYKDQNGIFGLIGETDELTFKDDNIGPDLAVAPPILDSSLRKSATVTFDQTADGVIWADHGLLENMPVVFQTTDRMPGVEEGKTYYVLNPGEDDFQIAETLQGTPVDFTGTDTGRHTAIGGNFPGAATYFEGRRVFGGSRANPQDVWMTASGTEADLSYSIPTVDSDRIYFRIASREISAIRHMIPMQQLILLSDSTEYRVSPVNDDAVTPTSISVRPQSFVGASYPPPSLVNNTVVFAASRGGHMRELGYSRDALGYLTGDLSVRAAHLFDGLTIVDQGFSKAPLPIVWCVSSGGKLLGLTYLPEERIGAWHQHTTPGGLFESVAVVPEGDEDAVYVVVNRGGTRYVERLADEFRGDTAELPDAYFVDSGITYEGTAVTSVAGLDHLEGQTVAYLADGVAGTATVASGAITLPTAASTVHVGLGFTTRIKTLPLTMMRVDAFGTGRQKNVNQVWVRIFQSGAFQVGPAADNLVPSRSPASATLDDDLVQVTLPGDWDDDGQVVIEQATPLPLTVVGLTIEVASGG